ncbi:MAG: hemerythrin domain-containing protein [Burkholderiaceae bacterium]
MSTELAATPALRVPAWDDALSLNLPALDDTHREFVALLGRAVQAADADLLPVWDEAVAHTRQHFEMENRGFEATRFPPGGCHLREHTEILAVMQEGLRRGRHGDLALVRQLASELGTWFEQHAQGMDAAFALYANWVGYDFASGAVAHPDRIPAAPEPTATCATAGTSA